MPDGLLAKSRGLHVGLTTVKCVMQNFHRRAKPWQRPYIEVCASRWILEMWSGCNHLEYDAKPIYLSCGEGQSRRQMFWNSNKRYQLFGRPYWRLRDEEMNLRVITSDASSDVRVHHDHNGIEHSFYNFDTECQASNSYEGKVFLGAVSSSLLTSREPDCDSESSNCTDRTRPRAPVGRGQMRPVDPLIRAQSEGCTEHDCTEFVVPGLKPRSDLDNHRSSAKYSRDRTMAHLRGRSTVFPITQGAIRPCIGKARPPRDRRCYLDSGMK